MTRTLRMLLLAVVTTTSWSVGTSRADVKLPRVFGDHMVLQQKSNAAIWGWAEAGEDVTVTLGAATATAKAGADGKWTVKLATPEAGGPHELVVKGKNEIKLTDVLIGEVWICSGQSNMEWSVSASMNAKEEIESAKWPQIRMIKAPKNPIDKPQDDLKEVPGFEGKWQVCGPESAGSFSAVGYYFARKLHQDLNVPIGMINTSWGGTLCEAWTSREALEADADFKPILDRASPFRPGNPNQAAALFNGMVQPFVPYQIRGAIWYQGESNVARAAQYRKLFPAMIADWRKRFGQGDFPFLFVQLAPYKYNHNPVLLAEQWESQISTLSVPNTGMAAIADVGNVNDIHPRNKQEVGRRLALWALAQSYGKSDLVYSGPLYESASVEGDKIRVKFKHIGGGLQARDGKPLSHFTIAGEDLKFVPAMANVDGDSVVVSASDVATPKFVRFAWDQLAEPNLSNKEGLPASPFRTDSAPLVSKDAR